MKLSHLKPLTISAMNQHAASFSSWSYVWLYCSFIIIRAESHGSLAGTSSSAARPLSPCGANLWNLGSCASDAPMGFFEA